jgi:hypothetical protein
MLRRRHRIPSGIMGQCSMVTHTSLPSLSLYFLRFLRPPMYHHESQITNPSQAWILWTSEIAFQTLSGQTALNPTTPDGGETLTLSPNCELHGYRFLFLNNGAVHRVYRACAQRTLIIATHTIIAFCLNCWPGNKDRFDSNPWAFVPEYGGMYVA